MNKGFVDREDDPPQNNVILILHQRITYAMVEVVSSRVDEDTRRKMRRLRHVNWSEVMRQAITQKIEEETRRQVDPAEVDKAIQLMDSVRKTHSNYDSAEEIRRWRDQRK